MERVLVPERKAGETLNNVFEENFLKYINELRNKLKNTNGKGSDYSETKDDLVDCSEDSLSKFSHKEILKMINGNYLLELII